jgi:hypothetical protein
MSGPDWDSKWGPPPPPASTAGDAVDALREEQPGRPGSLEVLVLASLGSMIWSLVIMYERIGICVAIALALDFALLYFLWAGRNWARVLVQLFSAFSLLGFAVFLLPEGLARHIDLTLRVKALFDAAIGLVSLFVLNTRAVRAFFHGPPITRPR